MTVYQCVSKKMKKKYVRVVAVYWKKCIFAVPIERETGRVPRVRKEMGKRLGMFIERMERCSKYSRIFLRFASDEVGTDKKEKKEIN